MKIKKILIVLLVFICGIGFVKAENTGEKTCDEWQRLAGISSDEKLQDDALTDLENDIAKLRRAYYITALFTVYESSIPDSEGKDRMEMAKGKLGIHDDVFSSTEEAKTAYSAQFNVKNNDGSHTSALFELLFGDDLKYIKNTQQIKNYNYAVEMYKYIDGTLNSAINLYEASTCTVTKPTSYSDVYENTEIRNSLSQSFTDFCDYLKSSTGLTNFLRDAIKIIKYVAILLAVILGILDFIKAISSQDDAALKKSFQSFLKRVIAVILIFAATTIVTIILNIIPVNGVNVDAAICDEVLFNN